MRVLHIAHTKDSFISSEISKMLRQSKELGINSLSPNYKQNAVGSNIIFSDSSSVGRKGGDLASSIQKSYARFGHKRNASIVMKRTRVITDGPKALDCNSRHDKNFENFGNNHKSKNL